MLNIEVLANYKTIAWGIVAASFFWFVLGQAQHDKSKKDTAESPTQLNLTLFSIYYKSAVQLGHAQW